MLGFLSGCAYTAKKVEVPDDLIRLPQSFEAYTSAYRSDKEEGVVPSTLKLKWFEPWRYTQAPQGLDAIMWPYRSYQKGVIYGPVLQPLGPEWFEQMRRLSDFDAFDTLRAYGMTVRSSDLRNFPTHDPLFRDPKEAGEGFPFDYNQNSGVHANEPLYLSHYSQDGDWIYVFTAYASGWLHVSDIALVGPTQKKYWEGLSQLYITQEDYPLKEASGGRYLLHSSIGTMLPIHREIQPGRIELLTAQRESDGSARFVPAVAPSTIGAQQPLPMDAKHLNMIGNQLLQEQYGWGGLLGRRDCSSMLRDYFAAFGLWLPRNSLEQSRIGKVIVLKGLSDEEKLRRIREEAHPFKTLLYKPGHVMLYLGVYNNEVIVFHDTWGIKTRKNTLEGRYIVGKSIISTFQLGNNLSDYNPNGRLLLHLESMNIVTLTP